MSVLPTALVRAHSLLWNGLRSDPSTLGAFIVSFVTGTKPTAIDEISEDDLSVRLRKGQSFIRVGDGEAMLLMGRSIHYQPYHPEIRTILREIIHSYGPQSPYVIGVPVFALTPPETSLRSRGKLRVWRLFRVLFQKRFPVGRYTDAVIFYRHGAFERIVNPILTNRHVIVLSNKRNLTNQTLESLRIKSANLSIIETPDCDAYITLSELKAKLDAAIAKHPDTRPLVLLAAGPTGKIIAYQYARAGVQCIDVGHGIEILGTTHDYSDRL